MKALKHFLLLFGLSLTTVSVAFSQQYTLRDQQEIAYQAQLTLNMYKDLLNVISYAGLANESEIKELIRNTYSDSGRQLFYSDAAIIEDNIKPSNLVSRHEQDKTIKDYLHYFDLVYEKSNEETIDFFDFEVSNLKYSHYLYIKVKYTCLFKGKHKEDTATYKAIDRVAELRVEKRGNQWKTFITSIVYYKPENPITSKEGDVELDRSISEGGTFSRLTEKSDPYYQDYSQGQSASAPKPEFLSGEEKFNYVKRDAENAYAARDYVNARNLFLQALRMRPEEKELNAVVEKLENIIQKTAILNSKYSVGEYKEAIKDYNKAIKEDRSNADYYYGRGRCFEKLEAVKEAVKDYSKAIELDGNFIEALSSRAQLYAEMSQFHQAVADYTLILSNPDYAASFYPERARIKKKMGDLNGALEDYNAAIGEDFRIADNHFEMGMIHLEQKKAQAAIGSFSEAIKNDPQHLSSFLQRGFAYVALENLQAASSDFEKARKLGLEEAQLAEIQKRSVKYYSVGEERMETGNLKDALKSFKESLLISPAFGRAWLRKGDAYFELSDYDSALLSYNKAVEYDHVSFAYFKRGLAYQKKKDSLSASNDFNRYIPIGKEVVARTEEVYGDRSSADLLKSGFVEERAEALYALGYAQLMRQQFEEALENMDLALRDKKNFPKAYFARGAALYALGDYKRAVKNMEKSIKTGLSDPIVFYSLGKAYLGNGQLEDAIFSYSHTIQLDPKHEAAYIERAGCYKSLRQYELALADIKAVLSLNEALKEDVSLITHKGLLELYQNKLGEANKSFDDALRLNRNDGWALYGKACALAQERKTEASLELYSKSFKTGQINWTAIKDDPLLKPVRKEKAFKELVNNYL